MKSFTESDMWGFDSYERSVQGAEAKYGTIFKTVFSPICPILEKKNLMILNFHY